MHRSKKISNPRIIDLIDSGFCILEKVAAKEGEPLDYRYIEVNKAFMAQSGKSDVVGKTVREVFPGEFDERFKVYDTILKTGEPVRFEREYRTQGRVLELYAFRVDEVRQHLGVIFKDITKRKKMEVSLREERLAAEERIQHQDKILEGIRHFQDALACSSEEDAGAVYLKVAKELTNSKMGIMGEVVRKSHKDIVISRPAWDSCHIENPTGHTSGGQEMEIHGLYGKILRDGKGFFTNDPPSHPDSIGTPEGHPPLTSFLGVPLLENGQILGIIAVANREGGYSDEDLETLTILSEAIVQVFMRRRAEKSLIAVNTELELANRRKGEFLGVLSHEIRNPITSIMMGLSLLDCVDPHSSKAHHTREIMKRQAKHLAGIVDDLLVMSRIDQNKIRLKKEFIELNDLIRKIAEDYRDIFQGQGINLEIVFSSAPVYVNADEIRLTQIIGNLLHNAVKYRSKDGGTVVTVALEETPEYAVIHFADTGIGIEKELLPYLFEPYVQAEASPDHGNGGLGLGLMLVKALTELHEGEVAACSDGPGKGSKFTVRFPLAKKVVHKNSAPPSKKIAEESFRVLVIEDIKDVANVLKSLLEIEGHEVIMAHTGMEGTAKAREFRPEIVICDIGLPDISGYRVAKTICSEKRLQNVFLISLTGHARPEDVKRAKEAGFHYHLAKPVGLEGLRKVLSQAVQYFAVPKGRL